MTWLKEFIYSFYLDRFDPTLEQCRLAVKTMIISAIVIAYGLICHQSQMLWLIIPAVFLLQTARGITKQRRIETLFISCILCVASIFAATLIGHYFWWFCLYGFILAMIAFSLSSKGLDTFIPAMLVLVMAMIAGCKPLPLDQALIRLDNTIIASVATLIIGLSVWRYRPKRLIKMRLALASKHLQQFSRWMLRDHICGITASPYCNELRVRCLNNLYNARTLLNAYPTRQQIQQWRYLYRIYGCLIAMSHLLDAPARSVSTNLIVNELKRIQAALEQSLNNLNNTVPQPGKSLRIIANSLQKAHSDNEDIISFTFLLLRLSSLIKEYHDAYQQH